MAAVIFVVLFIATACGAPETVETAPVETKAPPTTEVQETETEAPPKTTEVKSGKAFIWRVDSDSGTVYLMGSIHVGDAGIYPLDNIIEEAYELADNLVVEVDITNVNVTGITSLMIEYGRYPQGEGLKKSIPGELYTKLSDYFSVRGMSITLMDIFRPWFINTMMEQMELEALGYSTEYGIDMYFLRKATKSGKNIIELETAEFQIEIVASMPDELMLMAVEEVLEEPMTKEILEDLFSAWESGDTVVVESLIFEGMDENPEYEPFFQAIYTERNYSMADKIEEFLEDDEVYFVVVGAAHLVGDEGIVSILEDRGYQTEQLER